MAEITDTRQKLKAAIAVLVLVDVAMAAVFFSPIVGSQRSRKEELDRLLRYEAMINRQLNHAIGELERVQARRKGESSRVCA